MNINSVPTFNQPVKPSKPVTPPSGNIENRQPPTEPSKPNTVNSTQALNNTSIDANVLQSLQDIFKNYDDVSKLDQKGLNELSSRLKEAGLLESGTFINTSV
ncbi:MAG: hypothetical protein ABL903_15765 [Methylococcales bacterium]